jgi:hypothetical protein
MSNLPVIFYAYLLLFLPKPRDKGLAEDLTPADSPASAKKTWSFDIFGYNFPLHQQVNS